MIRRPPRSTQSRSSAASDVYKRQILFGGLLGPLLLLIGLRAANAASVSIWLNMELVATAILGVLIFKDSLDKFTWIGVILTLSLIHISEPTRPY